MSAKSVQMRVMSQVSKEVEHDFVISTEKTVLRTKVAEIVSAEVRCGRTGKQDEFYRLLFPDWVNIVALTLAREMILVKQFRFGSEKMEIEIPGGAIEQLESPVKAGVRELREETGYEGDDARVIGVVSPNPAIQNNLCYTVLIDNVERVALQKMDEMEDIEVLVLPLEKVAELVKEGRINHGLVLNALMFLERFS